MLDYNILLENSINIYVQDTTRRVAFEKGYKLIMPEETNTTFDNGNLPACEIYKYHNLNIFKDRFSEVKSLDEITICDIKQNNKNLDLLIL